MIIWIASYPRSGNTFFRVILNNLFGLNTYSLYNDNADIGADKNTSNIVGHELLPDDFDIEKARLSEELYLIKTHDHPANDDDKAIYLVRDGRESTLSYIKYKQNYFNTQQTLIDVIYGNVGFGGWGEHLEKWNPKNRHNTLLLKFEELVDEPCQFINKISDFIGVNPKQDGDIPTFEQLNKINPKFFHKGKKNSWKGQYTPAEHSSFWLKNYKQMMEYGYGQDKPPAFENAELVELLSALSSEYAYQSKLLKTQFNESLRNAQDNNKHYQKLLAAKDKQLEQSTKQIGFIKNQLEISDKKLLLQSNVLSNLKNKFDEICKISFYLHPYKKLSSYKSLIKAYSSAFRYLSTISNTLIPTVEKSKAGNNNAKESTPFFSIITITFNAADYLQATIDSVIKQTFDDIEYIIIDGCSNDATLEIIQENSKDITTWISEPDAGIYDAMNKGIALAKGRWVNFMNAGDKFSDEKILENIAKQIDSSSDVVYGDRYYIKDNKRELQLAKSIDTIFERMPFGHQSTFVRNVVLKKYRFNDTYKFAADYDLFVKLFLNGHNFSYIELPICDFMSGGKSESGIRPYLEVIKILLDNCKDKDVIEKNTYYNAFRKSAPKLLDSIIGN